MNLVAEVALWLAIIAAAWTAGSQLARWHSGAGGGSAVASYAMLATAALLVLSWGAFAGALLRQDPALAIVRESLPVHAGALHRMAAAWSTLRGAMLTLGVLLSLGVVVLAADDSHVGSTAATRLGGSVAAVVALVLLGGALVAPPLADATGASVPESVPIFLLHPAAAVAPLFALGAVAAGLILVCNALSVRGTAAPDVASGSLRRTAIAGWILATLALAAEQVARARLGITTQDAVALGSSSAVPILWLLLGALAHERVRRLLLAQWPTASHGDGSSAAWPVRLMHVGALLMVLGFALHIAAARTTLRLPPGQSAEAPDVFGRNWTLVNQGLSRFDAAGHDVTAIAVETTPPGGAPRLLSSELRRYVDGRTGALLGRPIGVRAVQRGPLQELRLVLADAAEGDVALVRVSFVPLVMLWHAGVALLLAGGIAALVVVPRPALAPEGESWTTP